MLNTVLVLLALLNSYTVYSVSVQPDSEIMLTDSALSNACVLVTPNGLYNLDLRNGSLDVRYKDDKNVIATVQENLLSPYANSIFFHRSTPVIEQSGQVAVDYVNASVLRSNPQTRWSVFSDELVYRAEITNINSETVVSVFEVTSNNLVSKAVFPLASNESITKAIFDPHDYRRLFIARGISSNPNDSYNVLTEINSESGSIVNDISITNSSGLIFQADFPSNDPFSYDGYSLHLTEYATIVDRLFNLATNTLSLSFGTGQIYNNSFEHMQSAGGYTFIWANYYNYYHQNRIYFSSNEYLNTGNIRLDETMASSLDLSEIESKKVSAYLCTKGSTGLVNTKLSWTLP